MLNILSVKIEEIS